MAIINQRVKKILKSKYNVKHEFDYLKYSKKPIKDTSVFLESTQGKSISGHIFYICKELVENYPELDVHISIRKEYRENAEKLLSENGFLSKVTLHNFLSDSYMKYLATSKYLFNDTTFWGFFNKRKEQKYFNFWHGTPLKCLGKDVNVLGFGNVQKNFLASDALILNNEYSLNHIIDSYMLNDISNGEYIVAPSARNSTLYSKEYSYGLKNRLQNNFNEVYLYMPTYRDNGTSLDKTMELIEEMENTLEPHQVLYLKLHPFDLEKIEIDFTKYKRVKKYPEEIETYQFLSTVDTLITDYSSIMYDFYGTGKRVLLYTYDKEHYLQDRGMYDDINKYPMKQVGNIKDLILELNKEYLTEELDKDFINKFSPYDNPNGTKEILAYLLKGESSENIVSKKVRNNKENVIFYSGGLWDNGITSAFLNTIDSIDLEERNYILYIKDSQVKKEHKYKLQELKIPYILDNGRVQYTFMEGFNTYLYLNTEWYGKNIFKKNILKSIKKMYLRDFNRTFGGVDVGHYIHYTGFERSIATIITALEETDTDTTVFYHTDMFAEIEAKKGSVNFKALVQAYERATNVAIVSEELKDRLAENLPQLENIKVMNNFLGNDKIKEKSKESIFTSLLNTPVYYANNKNLEKEIISDYGKYKQEEVFKGDRIKSTFLLNALGRSDKFKYIEENMDELNQAMNVKVSEILDFNGKTIEIKKEELGYLYRISKLHLIDEILNPSIKFYINIGRFDVQKGHDRLINSFEIVNKKDKNTRLVIVAPHGQLKKQTLKQVRESSANESIYVLGGMDNPYSLLKYCNAFIFSSLYEGLGLVVFEALAVGTNILTVEIPATTEGLTKGSVDGKIPAMIVENSQEGLTQGWLDFIEEDFDNTNFDFDRLKNRSLNEWKDLF